MVSTRWGIISAGKISHDFVTCLRSLRDHEVVVVAAMNVTNARKFALLHKIEKVLDNYDDMAKQDNIDIVYCGSLNPQHYTVVKHLLENGKPVLCEKPLTMCLEHTEELVKIARKNKTFLMEAIWSRFLPVYDELQKRHSEIGEIHSVEASFGLAEIGGVDRVTKPELGGSSLLDIGIYVIHFAQLIFKDVYPSEIRAVGEITPDGVDVQTCISLKYPSGKLASLTTSVLADLPCEATVFGSKGKIKVHKPFWCPDSIEVNGKTETFPYPATIGPCNYVNSSGLRYEAIHVRDCLNNGLAESPILPLEATLNMARIMQSCLDQMGAKLKI
ncbi:trans-1,2-dihydrobenzene-1,2-diol dehydrogenase-like [Varroa jacobsoni]|nr:trans-1,2-dihydrobenzene-1,2-diol dehydrogenase-like isoform X2 [Varroa destructor]XP_022662264.1 trans-1,2-dihydrobenzene-1,2-diol dehydrogenase-like isoform X2 [Varroa destructor]XP_022703799.1 trans-1,2-dihydrobenzene-1,2-diol dehydrogenase-like [Varroa jacobsoni]